MTNEINLGKCAFPDEIALKFISDEKGFIQNPGILSGVSRDFKRLSEDPLIWRKEFFTMLRITSEAKTDEEFVLAYKGWKSRISHLPEMKEISKVEAKIEALDSSEEGPLLKEQDFNNYKTRVKLLFNEIKEMYSNFLEVVFDSSTDKGRETIQSYKASIAKESPLNSTCIIGKVGSEFKDRFIARSEEITNSLTSSIKRAAFDEIQGILRNKAYLSNEKIDFGKAISAIPFKSRMYSERHTECEFHSEYNGAMREKSRVERKAKFVEVILRNPDLLKRMPSTGPNRIGCLLYGAIIEQNFNAVKLFLNTPESLELLKDGDDLAYALFALSDFSRNRSSEEKGHIKEILGYPQLREKLIEMGPSWVGLLMMFAIHNDSEIVMDFILNDSELVGMIPVTGEFYLGEGLEQIDDDRDERVVYALKSGITHSFGLSSASDLLVDGDRVVIRENCIEYSLRGLLRYAARSGCVHSFLSCERLIERIAEDDPRHLATIFTENTQYKQFYEFMNCPEFMKYIPNDGDGSVGAGYYNVVTNGKMKIGEFRELILRKDVHHYIEDNDSWTLGRVFNGAISSAPENSVYRNVSEERARLFLDLGVTNNIPLRGENSIESAYGLAVRLEKESLTSAIREKHPELFRSNAKSFFLRRIKRKPKRKD